MVLVASGWLLGTGAHRDAAQAACLRPSVVITPRAAPAGSTVTVQGREWRTGCNDTVDCPNGGPCAKNPSAPPHRGIRLRFSQGTNNDALGVVDASNDASFSFTAVVPTWARAGAATVKAEDVAVGFLVGDNAGGVAIAPPSFALAPGTAGEPLPKTGGGQTGALAGLAALLVALAVRRLSLRRPSLR